MIIQIGGRPDEYGESGFFHPGPVTLRQVGKRLFFYGESFGRIALERLWTEHRSVIVIEGTDAEVKLVQGESVEVLDDRQGGYSMSYARRRTTMSIGGVH